MTALVSSSVHACFPLGFGDLRTCLWRGLALELVLELLDETAGDETREAAAATGGSAAVLHPYRSVG